MGVERVNRAHTIPYVKQPQSAVRIPAVMARMAASALRIPTIRQNAVHALPMCSSPFRLDGLVVDWRSVALRVPVRC